MTKRFKKKKNQFCVLTIFYLLFPLLALSIDLLMIIKWIVVKLEIHQQRMPSLRPPVSTFNLNDICLRAGICYYFNEKKKEKKLFNSGTWNLSFIFVYTGELVMKMKLRMQYLRLGILHLPPARTLNLSDFYLHVGIFYYFLNF